MNASSSTTIEPARILQSGKTVLSAESRALALQAEQLDGPFIDAVRLLVDCKGRVIVTGMGKSGHIARKIAATMASTGTPAQFVHPGEASHGDMGMIIPGDVVIAISNSGETKELADILTYTRRFEIPLIAITSREQSALGSAADVLLILPNEPEVGALGLAPTTSTTMSLALGDALAVATLECKGFTREDFGNYHPGGKLGQSLLRVKDLMLSGDALPLAKGDEKMQSVLLVMSEKGLGCAGIVDAQGTLIGMITDGDLRRHMGADLLQMCASDVMTKNPMTMKPSLMAAEALKLMNQTKRSQVFVVEGEPQKPVGIITLHTLLAAKIA